MLRPRLTLLSLACIAVLAAAAVAQAPNWAAPPGVPSQVPPAVGVAAPAPASQALVSMQIPKGWSVVSFPLARVTATRGFTHQLFRYAGTGYYPVDPVAAPTSIDTRLAYLAYADAPTQITLEGTPNAGIVRSIALQSGWNLIGCPSSSAIPLANVTVTSGTVTRPLSAVAGTSAATDWLSASAFVLEQPFPLTAPQAALSPQKGVWAFAWRPLRLHLRASMPAQQPRIDAVVPSSVAVGGAVDVNGHGFGTGGTVTVAGMPVPSADVLIWGPQRIQFRVPSTAQSGNVSVSASHLVSNAMPLTVGGGGGLATLLGQVQDTDGHPVAGAQILLDSGQKTKTGTDGSWIIQNVPPGQHLAYVTDWGYDPSVGQVQAVAGTSKSVLIQMSKAGQAPSVAPSGAPPSGQPAAKRGTLHVIADSYDDGQHRWWVSHIAVQQYGDYSAGHWDNWWSSDLGDTSYELDCPGAVVGQTYTIRVDWKRDGGGDPLSNMWYKKMYTTYQNEEFDSPY